jgi:porin
MGYARVSNGMADADKEYNLNNPGATIPVQGGETFVEVTYQYQLTPWCNLQPDFQYVFNPGGGLSNPSSPGQRIKDEAVFGLRANIIF